MKLASLDANICLRKTQYLLVFISDTFLLLVYDGLHYATQSDPDVTKCLKLWLLEMPMRNWRIYCLFRFSENIMYSDNT